MSITLCMVVRDEANALPNCLTSILPHVDEVLIADTGSEDGTAEQAKSICGAEVFHLQLDPADCYSVTSARNFLYERVRTDWVFYLDADEQLESASGAIIRAATTDASTNIGGFFGQWLTFLPGRPIEDYKLFLFRRGLRKHGIAHANVQLDIRMKGESALWLDGLQVKHIPAVDKFEDKRSLYRKRLAVAMRLEPDWLRHNWFAGYMSYQEGDYSSALSHFHPLIFSQSKLFPVEGLNARMVAIEMAARSGAIEKTRRLIEEAIAFHKSVEDDFEVRVNFRSLPWLKGAADKLKQCRTSEIQAYAFCS
jgi:glycosyltransferase involved in cell wall biosynthesis